MKRCPKCKADYFDNLLEFCLEDGTRLAFAPQSAVATAPGITAVTGGAPIAERPSQETVVIPSDRKAALSAEPAENTSTPAVRVIERAAVGLALTHNWWQWLYLEKAYVYSIADYLLSANFLMWLLLLCSGLGAGVYSFRQSRDKTFAVISLVTLAINLILFLVPRR